MDDIAMNDDRTQADRADRAREAWRVYSETYSGSMIRDLITDLLHLADIDEPDGADAAEELGAAVSNYEGELPTWPTEGE